jgi:hypothetical protein
MEPIHSTERKEWREADLEEKQTVLTVFLSMSQSLYPCNPEYICTILLGFYSLLK